MQASTLTRRALLSLVGKAGGSYGLWQTGLALGLINRDAYAGPISVAPSQANKGKKIAILGAGISGLTAAYELEQAGYDVIVLEASFRAGGRNLTVRKGDKIDEMGHPRICQFDDAENMYFNCGPARIPGHHRRTLHYCKLFNLPLQVKANSNGLAYTYEEGQFGAKPRRIVDYQSDARGLLSELIWKSANSGQFDERLSVDDLLKLKEFVQDFGDLSDEGIFEGTDRAGSTKDRMMHAPSPEAPKELSAIINSHFWQSGGASASAQYDWLEPLLEIKGGMDGLVNGFTSSIKSPIELGAQVKKIINTADGVEVAYEQNGELKTIEADYVFNGIPAYFMKGIENNFSERYQAGLDSFKRERLFKIGLQMKKRFWEDEGIYGGISYSELPNAQIWYPSHDIHAPNGKGIILAAYVWTEEDSLYFENMSPEERLVVAGKSLDKIHPGASKYIETGVSVPWARMNHQMGCGIRQSPEDHDEYFAVLQKPEGRHFMIGDQMSHHTGWQEGAVAAVEHALKQFDVLVSSEQGA